MPQEYITSYDAYDDKTFDLRTYWKYLGRTVLIFCIPLVLFTVFLGLTLDGVLDWSYWRACAPLFVLLLLSLLLTSSQRLTAPVPIHVRITWVLWIVSLTTFVVLLLLNVDSEQLFLGKPTLEVVWMPLWIIAGVLFLSGFYVTFILGCCCAESPESQQKFMMSGVPLFCFSLVFGPSILLISFKTGVLGGFSAHVAWSVVFIPLFVADGFCFCMGFFLILFSCGGRNDALFSISQLFLFVGTIPLSVVFKILLALRLDGKSDIKVIYIFIPLLVLEALFFVCGLNMALSSSSKKYDKLIPESGTPSSTSPRRRRKGTVTKSSPEPV